MSEPSLVPPDFWADVPIERYGPVCSLHSEHGEREWCECWQCGSAGVFGHDCGEDCCCCLDPEDNQTCDICNGRGGWWRCYTCAPDNSPAADK